MKAKSAYAASKFRYLRLGLALAVAICSVCCKKPLPARSELVMGTLCTVNCYNQGTDELYREIFARLREIEQLMSASLPGNELDTLNQLAGVRPLALHQDLLEVLGKALEYAELSDGAFDPTVGPLVKLWGIGSDAAKIPQEEEIHQALDLVDYSNLELDFNAGTGFLKKAGMMVDLGAIAKGYAADEVVKILEKAQITGAIVDLGGNVFAYGVKEGAMPWRIGVQNPLESRGSYLGVLELVNKTIVTSGVYERFFEADGRRYHHILSTRDGYPVNNALISVTIIADRSIDGDGLSTSIFAMGYEAGCALVESLSNVYAIFVFDNQEVRLSSGAEEFFTLTNTDFRLVSN